MLPCILVNKDFH